jgi:hypothetical protein
MEGIRFFFSSSHLFYILSSEPVQTDITRSSLNPVLFFLRHFYFRYLFSKKKTSADRLIGDRRPRRPCVLPIDDISLY